MRKDFYVICENLRSLYNIGSIFRTADALGLDKVLLGGISGTSLQKGVKKVALGAEEHVPWEHHWQTWRMIDRLKDEGFQIISLEVTPASRPLNCFVPRFPCALVLGNEVTGVSKGVRKRSEVNLEIPMAGIKESLNVAVAFGIAGWELSKYRKFL